MNSKILIVGTVPFNRQTTSRAFDAYFHYIEKDRLAQIFSDSRTPLKGHCGTLYQITDYMMLKRWLSKKNKVGKIYNYNELNENVNEKNVENKDDASTLKQIAYKFGRMHIPLTHILRKILWKKRYWCTKKLNDWLDDFKPDCVFLSFSDDYFIPKIAMYVAKKYNIPIISSIGDDYYFNKHFSFSLLYNIYKDSYRSLIRKVFEIPGSAIYISDKIRDKYNKEFNLDGETVYLTSDIKRKAFKEINEINPVITYFGNIRMGRNLSLNDIGNTLGKISDKYKLEIYSTEKDKRYFKIFTNNKNIEYKGAVGYEVVMKRMIESDITIIVEGFRKKDIELSRYSLSTKAADALASGCQILAYGSSECGIIEYMKSTNAAFVCDSKKELEEVIKQMIHDKKIQQGYYENQIKMTNEHHNLKISCATFENVVEKVVRRTKNVKR